MIILTIRQSGKVLVFFRKVLWASHRLVSMGDTVPVAVPCCLRYKYWRNHCPR